ncbi:hypothetical protein K2173_001442 [Erythroxylum novogranatense]|uniref:Retrotransposon Copia-like N-terminal domain-containing protein n=1 Tax=Erythroxylum novogranatense TaxID=1862640 RepID=A0AAV8TBH8_9ROSI|nr:hypothetical protein K2173_001442 [Erythroxylum novogranatense]
MTLVASPLTGNNYLPWSIAVKTSLEAKDKICFIDGSFPAPTNPVLFKKWKRVDSMIKAWLLNSMTKEMSDTFIYCVSSKVLWDTIEKRLGENNGPLRYQLQREVSSLEQGSDSREESTKLMQFLMGLNPTFDNVRSQILNLEPLPHIDKAYSMVLRVEK